MRDIQTYLALLGIVACALGALAGRNHAWLRGLMAFHVVVGVASMSLRAMGQENVWAGNLWALSNAAVIMPFVSQFSLEKAKPVIYVLTGLCIWLWATHVYNNGICVYAPMVRAAVSLSIASACGLAALSGVHRVLLVTLALASMADAMLYSFSLEWFKFNPPHAWWAIRNLIWCGVYISMAYTVRRR